MLVWPPMSGETSRLSSMDPVAERDQVQAAWWQEKQDKVVDMSRCRVAAVTPDFTRKTECISRVRQDQFTHT
jgi:hypothetical protein